jgi:hypothetical protein
MADTDSVLLGKINAAVAEHNAAEQAVTTAQSELVSKSKVVGQLLLEAKKHHPKVADFEAFLKRVKGLKLSRAYDLLRLAGGRTTDEELRKDARERVRKHRAKKKIPARPKSITEPEPVSVTDPDVTESHKRITQSPEISAEERRSQNAALDSSDLSIPPFLDRTKGEAATPATIDPAASPDNPISAAFWAATEKQRREFVNNNWIAMYEYYRTSRRTSEAA